MRSAVAAFLPSDIREVTPELARKIRQAGFVGVTGAFGDPFTLRDSELDRARETLAEAGVRLAQYVPQYEAFVHPDESCRRRGIRTLLEVFRVAARLEASTVYLRPGSLNLKGQWTPHPQNRSQQTFERLVRSLKEVCPVAQSLSLCLAIEGHTVSPLPTPERVRSLLERVGSPALRFNVDPVNFVDSLESAYETRPLLNRLFDMLGPFTVAAHVKDVGVQDHLVLHIEERPPGHGHLDFQTFIRRFESCCPEGYFIVEHLNEEQIGPAKKFLDGELERAGVQWKEDAAT
ncbi:MAG: sugar phosphate isomerase/epimerase [Planctomycetes bacterium]|nr:sugar phosphate isomerase/epimerase [Planctomycetota bacterium]